MNTQLFPFVSPEVSLVLQLVLILLIGHQVWKMAAPWCRRFFKTKPKTPERVIEETNKFDLRYSISSFGTQLNVDGKKLEELDAELKRLLALAVINPDRLLVVPPLMNTALGNLVRNREYYARIQKTLLGPDTTFHIQKPRKGSGVDYQALSIEFSLMYRNVFGPVEPTYWPTLRNELNSANDNVSLVSVQRISPPAGPGDTGEMDRRKLVGSGAEGMSNDW